MHCLGDTEPTEPVTRQIQCSLIHTSMNQLEDGALYIHMPGGVLTVVCLKTTGTHVLAQCQT